MLSTLRCHLALPSFVAGADEGLTGSTAGDGVKMADEEVLANVSETRVERRTGGAARTVLGARRSTLTSSGAATGWD